MQPAGLGMEYHRRNAAEAYTYAVRAAVRDVGLDRMAAFGSLSVALLSAYQSEFLVVRWPRVTSRDLSFLNRDWAAGNHRLDRGRNRPAEF